MPDAASHDRLDQTEISPSPVQMLRSPIGPAADVAGWLTHVSTSCICGEPLARTDIAVTHWTRCRRTWMDAQSWTPFYCRSYESAASPSLA